MAGMGLPGVFLQEAGRPGDPWRNQTGSKPRAILRKDIGARSSIADLGYMTNRVYIESRSLGSPSHVTVLMMLCRASLSISIRKCRRSCGEDGWDSTIIEV